MIKAARAIHVNQVGYMPDALKRATLVCDSTKPMRWELRDDDGAVVASGETVFRGVDPTVGAPAHVIDFSAVTAEGKYSLSVTLDSDAVKSDPVIIGANLYDGMLFDALNFFMLQRSGIEIGPEVAGPEYARAAGHLDVAPNRGDGAVPPLPKGRAISRDGKDLYEGWGGDDYVVNGRGGWYDAGDMGKYVVNAGISVAQLLGIVEREMREHNDIGPGSVAAVALAEAKWELDWMLRMQLPVQDESGEVVHLGGLVHHKLHDEHWTGIPMLPADDPMLRYVHRPSTAATLNLVAVAAQMARITAKTEPGYSAQLLAAADIGYAAAKLWPVLLAPDTNEIDNFGAGPYNDSEVDDEFYWAAAELYLTTGDSQYLEDLRQNPYHLGGAKSAFSEVGFDWRDVAAWVRMQLALVDSELPERDEVIASLKDAAEQIIATNQPFGQLYDPKGHNYAWGSNGMIANNAAIVSAAYEATGDFRFRKAALEGLDYLLGRNALGISYVTGYGVRDVRNQHSRWFAHAVNPSLPNPPPGTLSGGPNSEVGDEVVNDLAGSPAQLCFRD
ncbi:MAG: glycoside hydrolase family 9 protein, partial [Promicromonosporaceae bacterium]|nr:glycoside hydrolase family 9 protein [Promicromonosporaceae bacterium]